MRNCMLDLETLGTRPGSVVLSIGAVFFDPLMNEPGPAFYQVIDVASSCVAGLRGEHDVIAWWEKQSGEARVAYDEAFGGQGEPLKKTLEAFATWLVSQSREPDGAASVRVWGKGPAFDNAILTEAYLACGLAKPWKYSHDRCFRTLIELGRERDVKAPPFRGVKHHALDDAVHQANWACLILRALSPQPVPEGDRGYRSPASHKIIDDGELAGYVAPLGTESQELMPDPPAGYVKPREKVWPVCAVHGTAMVPTSSGFVCERCGGGA